MPQLSSDSTFLLPRDALHGKFQTVAIDNPIVRDGPSRSI
jgi:hypothetical protein